MFRDPEIPRHKKKAMPSRKKKWGIEYWSNWFQQWFPNGWYGSERQRDQAYESLVKGHKRAVAGLRQLGGPGPKQEDSEAQPAYRKVDR